LFLIFIIYNFGIRIFIGTLQVDIVELKNAKTIEREHIHQLNRHRIFGNV